MIIEGREVALQQAGEHDASRPSVVLLNGAGDASLSWLAVAHRISPMHHVVSFDRAGMGRSAAGPSRTLEGYLSELEEVLGAVTSGPAVLVGHSFGGLLARVFAAVHPEQTAALVLVDATPEAIAGEKAVAAGFAVSAGIASAFRAGAPLGLVRALLRLHALPLYPGQRRFEAQLTSDEVQRWRAAVDAGFRTGAVEELRSVLPGAASAAALLASTSGSGEFPVAMVTSRAYGEKWVGMHDDMAAGYPGSTHTYSGDRNHNIHMAHPDLVAQAVAEVTAPLPR